MLGRAPSSIVGEWTLNKDLSDPPQNGENTEGDGGRRGGRGDYGRGGGMGRGGGGMRRGGGMGRGGGGQMSSEDMQRLRDAARDIRNPPDQITIIDTGTMILITAKDGRVTRLSPDGKKIKDENTKVERKTKWESGKLVSEVTGLGPGKITETYSGDPEHHQLLVSVTVENPRMPKPIVDHRVYDGEAR